MGRIIKAGTYLTGDRLLHSHGHLLHYHLQPHGSGNAESIHSPDAAILHAAPSRRIKVNVPQSGRQIALNRLNAADNTHCCTAGAC